MSVVRFRHRHDGAVAYALGRLRGIVRPPVAVTEPAAGSIVVDHDVPVTVRDGTVLRVNVHRPPGAGPFPVIVCTHPYGKDRLPSVRGRRARVSFQYRILRQTTTVPFSTLTSWEAPDPLWWAGHGYAVVNADLRGAGTSGGTGRILSEQEGEDCYDLVEWAGAQEWGTGAVGLLGVSYLALSQYRVAALRPPGLRAICPWEGFTDAYRDLMMPGGIREDGFVRVWSAGLRKVRLDTDVRAEQRHHPLRDGFWRDLAPDLAAIDGKWATFYNEPARGVQLQFFERYLRGRTDVPAPPRVRLEVRASQREVVEVRNEEEYPLARTRWTPHYLAPGGELVAGPPEQPGSERFHTRRETAVFSLTFAEDTELTGPMAARLWVESPDLADVTLVVGVEKWSGGRPVRFEGSYGWGRDRVATGWQRAALRELDPERSVPHLPVHTFATPEPLRPGMVEEVQVALGHSATWFRAGESLRFVVAGRWLSPFDPLTGQFPARYAAGPAGHCTLHWGPDRGSHLLVPVIPRDLT
jgi:hypothetical protein